MVRRIVEAENAESKFVKEPPNKSKSGFRKYTSLAVAIKMLHSKEITLLKPSTWDDKNDAHFMAEYKDIIDATNVFAACFSEAQETYHHWRVFAHGPDGVCIEFDKEMLLGTFENDLNIRQGKVRYQLIDALRQRASIDPEELPFLKRKPYEHETEYRVVYVDTDKPVGSVAYELDIRAIKRITLSPWMPLPLRDAVADTLQNIKGCRHLKVFRSTLVGNNEWQAMTNKARLPVVEQR